MSSPFSLRWRPEEPQSFIILTLTLAILFLTPWSGCNPQRNHKEWLSIKQQQQQEERALARPPATLPAKPASAPKPSVPLH